MGILSERVHTQKAVLEKIRANIPALHSMEGLIFHAYLNFLQQFCHASVENISTHFKRPTVCKNICNKSLETNFTWRLKFINQIYYVF